MTHELVSVIVPIYKVELYLDKCIQSIVNQTYDNLEIILVDDGSPDRCGEICDEWAKKDSRIRVFHQKNQGVSVARNVGLQYMNGIYFTCIDPDDFWHSDYIEEMLIGANKTNADLVFCGLSKIDEANNITLVLNRPKELLTGDQINQLIWGKFGYVIGGVCKLFKSEIVKNKHLSYIPGLKNGEDWIFLYDYLKYCSSVYHIGKPLYYCLNRSDSASSNVSKEKFPEPLIDLWNIIKEKNNSQIKYEPWTNLILSVAVEIIISSYWHNYFNHSSFNETQYFIKNNRINFLLHAKMPNIKKVNLLGKLYFPKVYQKLLKVYICLFR